MQVTNNTRFVTFDIFNNNPKDILSIINHGELIGSEIKMITSKGEVINSVSALAGEYAKVIALKDIDVHDSIYYWHKRTNFVHRDKPIRWNQMLTIGEVYRGNCWRYSLMIHPMETEIQVKIFLEN